MRKRFFNNKYAVYSIIVSLMVLTVSIHMLLNQIEKSNEKAVAYEATNDEVNGAIKPKYNNDNRDEAEEATKDTYEDIKATKKEKLEDEEKIDNTKEQIKPQEATINMEPINSEEYIVKENDSLYLIAKRASLTIEEIKKYNNINTDKITVGQVLVLKPTKTSEIEVTASRGETRADDIYWLSRIIHAEAQGEPYEGKVAVGNVILNRVKSSDFPNTIYGVIFDKQHGYTQFSPVIDGTVNNTPNNDSIKAAAAALNGEAPVGEVLYFLNPVKSTNFWIVENRRFYKTIGDHDFYY
ncbi:cell wall hydrolase [Alkaliphilus pronyensis]|uniref:cell wall hydrolase n=1 Tax=Alkaliphilus pronyensis TaxID=1482732 RepID=UPI001A9AC2C2|nr:cell wall hydrolase [Alkaliphilus pronyensis]